nr:MAG TPA: putative zinc finger/helix-turn-helix protein, YgiT family [Caudoviricetes sp.]
MSNVTKRDNGVKEIRKTLKITQDCLARIIGVTKATIVRYEQGSIVPTGTINSKIQQLSLSLNDESERSIILDVLESPGGYAVLAAILAFTVSISPVDGAVCSMRTMLLGKYGVILKKTINKMTQDI